MKRILVLTVGLVACFAMGSAFALDLTNSPHDLSSTSTASIKTAGTDQLCAFCHTPHGAGASTYGPLWNRNYTPGSFSLYSSSTFNGGTPALGPQSYACLSCHDGTIALDNLANVPGPGKGAQPAGFTFSDHASPTLSSNKITNGAAAVGTDLSNDHPVGFTYATSAGEDAGIKATPTGSWATFYSGKMECATCHNVHDHDGPGTYTMFLRGPTAGSALCRDCHVK